MLVWSGLCIIMGLLGLGWWALLIWFAGIVLDALS